MKAGIGMAHYLVTGGCGFIGSNLVKRLQADGHTVTIIDDLSLGVVDHRPPTATFFRTRPAYIAPRLEAIDHYNFDGIFHLGMPSSSPMYKDNPNLVSEVIQDAIAIYNLASKKNAKVVVASTSSLYNGNDLPYKENMPINVSDFYTEARYYVERLGWLHMLDRNLRDPVFLRLFSVYGQGEEHKERFANLATQFLWAMQEGHRCVVYGDGKQTRDFVHVDDVVEAFITAMTHLTYGVFNVGTGIETSINSLIELLGDVTKTTPLITYRPNPVRNYVQRTCANTWNAENLLKWKAKIPLREGLVKLAESYQ